MNQDQTRPSLLLAVRDPQNGAAWAEFTSIYRPLLLSYVKKKGLNDSDAEEVVQDVLVKLVREMPKFQLNHAKGRFRTWLFTVFIGTFLDRYRKHKRQKKAENAYTLAARSFDEDKREELEAEWDMVYRRHLLQVLLERVKPSVAEKTWVCFEQHVKLGRPAKEVAAALQMEENTVYVYAKRILDKLRKLAIEELGEDPF